MSVTRAIDFPSSNRGIVADILNEIRIFNRYIVLRLICYLLLYFILLSYKLQELC